MRQKCQQSLVGFLALFVLSACSTVSNPLDLVMKPSSEPPQVSKAPDSPSASSLDLRIGALEPQTLSRGSCGLFLWSRTAERKFVLYSESVQVAAKMEIDGRDVRLERVSAEGEPMFGHYPDQTFRFSDITVHLSLFAEPRPGVISGAVVPRGTLRFIQDDGWEFVIPVGGIIACEA